MASGCDAKVHMADGEIGAATAAGDAELLDALQWIMDGDGSVHAYQTVTAKAMLDSGANLNVFKSRALPHMKNKRDSKFGVGGFTGGEVQADTFGMLHMYVFDPASPEKGVDLALPGTTMKGDVHSDLISV
jgi:hypothetical protein